MDRARRIWRRGWLRRAISVFSFGYYPVHDAVFYIVTADVECRFVGLMDSAVSLAADAGAELRRTVLGDVTLALVATSNSEIAVATGVADVEL